jgi:hypothetical protein
MRIPGGDAIQRVWACGDHGGMTIIEVENDSPAAFAVAFSGGELLTSRPPTEVPIEGIDLPGDTIVLPVAHRTRVRVARCHGAGVASRLGSLPNDIAGPNEVAGGWLEHVARASRLVLPDPSLVASVVADRCALALDGPDEASDEAYLLGVAELVRMGEDPAPWVLDVASAAQRLVVRGRRGDALASPSLWAAAAVLAAAQEAGAAADVVSCIVRLRLPEDGSVRPALGGAATAVGGPGERIERIEGLVARPANRGVCVLFPTGIPRGWWGANFEAHGLRAGPTQRLSVAVRWHGERPAVLWEVEGAGALTLTGGAHDPVWRTDEPKGEALLVAPDAGRSSR